MFGVAGRLGEGTSEGWDVRGALRVSQEDALEGMPEAGWAILTQTELLYITNWVFLKIGVHFIQLARGSLWLPFKLVPNHRAPSPKVSR